MICFAGCNSCEEDDLIVVPEISESLCVSEILLEGPMNGFPYVNISSIDDKASGHRFLDSICMNIVASSFSEDLIILDYLTFEIDEITLDTSLREQIRLLVKPSDTCSILTPLDFTGFSESMINYTVFDEDVIDARYELDDFELYNYETEIIDGGNMRIVFSCVFSIVTSQSPFFPELVSFSEIRTCIRIP